MFFSISVFQLLRQRFSPLCAVSLVLLSLSIVSPAQETSEDELDPVAIFNQGQDAHEKGDLAAAVKFYEQALKIAPEFPEAEFQRGGALLILGKRDEAEKSFRRAAALRPDWSPPLSSLGELLIRNNRLPEAEKVLLKAVSLDAQNFPALAALTELRIKSKADPVILRELLEKVKFLSEKAKPTASVWAARGALENALGDKLSAKNSSNRALEIDARNLNALFLRGEIALAEGDVNRAAEIMKVLSQIASNAPEIKIFEARLLIEAGKPDEAQKLLGTIQSDEATALREKIAASNSVNAVDLEKRLENDSKNATILSRLCTLLRSENPAKAIEYCRRAAEAEPNNVNHAVGYGAALVQAKRFDEAAQLFRRLKDFAPDNYTVRANLATALFQLNRYAEAKIEYQWLVEKQPDLPIAHYFLGITHDQLNEYLDAMANYQQFLRLADAAGNKLEIEKVNLRLPVLQRQIKEKGKNANGKQ
ncbi:MAG TPA: tetratricopeptide repeat protein [Pyrinomonadaceae bacterium]